MTACLIEMKHTVKVCLYLFSPEKVVHLEYLVYSASTRLEILKLKK